MDFLKSLLLLQHHQTLTHVADKLSLHEFDQAAFITTYDKRNYCLIKVCNCLIKEPRVQIKDLLSTLDCDHNPSSSR